ncbi:ABC transporter ATP-binding protein [uncultured Lamprocystis sp.]|jgi:putative ABC transport system ATP-binding protein|uniref:ABC transporter ATP-binding protein n=1 Tax=uncultured Lamprocystis sp. TaxID=543132 RepID=UPI0025FCD747|nr:ATP-binding cassette domain-containing protein [uncultured Lamprocystis sp.]
MPYPGPYRPPAQPAAAYLTAAPVLAFENLMKSRGQGGVGFELHVPAFAVRPGELVALVGESGCGKSTLLDLLALVSRPTRCAAFRFQAPGGATGALPIDIAALWAAGREAALARVRRDHLGYVLQTGGLLPFLSVRQNLELPMQVQGLANVPGRVEAWAARMGVEGLLGKKPQFLSGGQRQRVAILRALIHQPALVLADEPTAAVDRTRARRIVADFRALARDGGSTIVMVTHDRPLMDGVADRTFGFTLEQVSDTLTRSTCREGVG